MDPEQLLSQKIINFKNLSKFNFELAEKTNDQQLKFYLMGKSDAYELASKFLATDKMYF